MLFKHRIKVHNMQQDEGMHILTEIRNDALLFPTPSFSPRETLIPCASKEPCKYRHTHMDIYLPIISIHTSVCMYTQTICHLNKV